ncbi:hypothetical protein GGR24_002354 [Hansschlegelia beijingensis]|uniref:Uncharacterized protein n=1 Tax=Hansschlegelia beijingensis TaxID=1133344 RepID=A0A7W6GHE7_9HYPH|nr:hypothetical protein [Hansschlegelia beijingensis]
MWARAAFFGALSCGTFMRASGDVFADRTAAFRAGAGARARGLRLLLLSRP